MPAKSVPERLSENVENYLKHILRISKEHGSAKTGEIAKAVGVAPASVTEMLRKLEAQGFIDYDKYHGAKLTEDGYFRALGVLKKFKLAEKFLEEVVGMDAEAAEVWGCKMEHVIPPELEEWFYQQLVEKGQKRRPIEA